MKSSDIQLALGEPFPRADIEFRVCRASTKNRKASVLAYITARGIMQRLDAVFGIGGWKDEYEVLQTGVKCKLSVKIDGEWIAKEDVGPFTNIEALKGAFSDSLKRAGVKFGIGRYLYDLPESWVEILADRPRDTNFPVHYHNSDGLTGYWVEPQLPEWALPSQQRQVPSEYRDKLDSLMDRQLLTTAKHEQFLQALAHPKATELQKTIIWDQLCLIELWSASVPNNTTLDQEQKRELYRKILNSNSKNIDAIRSEIQSYSTAQEAA